MKLKLSDLQKLAREETRKHKEALKIAVQNDGGITSHQDYDVGYHQGRLHLLGEIYNLIRRKKS